MSAYTDAMGLRCDWAANDGRLSIQLLLFLYRLAQRSRSFKTVPGVWVSILIRFSYRMISMGAFGIDLPTSTCVGPGLAIHHGFGLVVTSGAKLGSGVVLRQSTTIGTKFDTGDAPLIGDSVSIGPNSVLLGAIEIGSGSVIGAGSVVVSDVRAGDVVAGNPARSVAVKRKGGE